MQEDNDINYMAFLKIKYNIMQVQWMWQSTKQVASSHVSIQAQSLWAQLTIAIGAN